MQVFLTFETSAHTKHTKPWHLYLCGHIKWNRENYTRRSFTIHTFSLTLLTGESGELGVHATLVINFWDIWVKMLHRKCHVSWNIVMVENTIVGPKFRPFSIDSFMQLLPYFHIIRLVDCLAFWNEFKMNNTTDIKKSYVHYLQMWFQHASFHGLWGCQLFPLQTGLFAFGIILKASCFISFLISHKI
jgi:hypothetical protein